MLCSVSAFLLEGRESIVSGGRESESKGAMEHAYTL